MSAKKLDIDMECSSLGAEAVKPLLTKLSVCNFMCYKSLELTASTQTIIPYKGGEGEREGKSAFVVAVLIGLGYDIMMETEHRHSLCGIEISSVVHNGENQCTLKTTISLHSSKHLQSIFGPYATLIRYINRHQELKLSPFEIGPSDARGNCYGTKKRITAAEIRLTLDMIGISSKWYRLLLLDETNLTHLVDHKNEWYELYESAYLATKRKLFKDYLAMDLHSDKMEDSIQWRLLAESHFDSELQKPYLKDSPMLIHDRNNDIKALNKIREAMKSIREEIDSCRDVNSGIQKELEDLHVTFDYNMSKTFRRVLNSQNLTGDLLIDRETKQIGIYITNSREVTVRTMAEALASWEKSSNSRKKLAVIALYLTLWQINETCPIFIVDSYSDTETEFKLPQQVIPILNEIFDEKRMNSRTDHQQVIYTVKRNAT